MMVSKRMYKVPRNAVGKSTYVLHYVGVVRSQILRTVTPFTQPPKVVSFVTVNLMDLVPGNIQKPLSEK